MKEFWGKRIQNLEPYVPGEQPRDRRYIKLNTNENPYPPSPKALAAMQDALEESLKLYPDPNSTGLKKALADYTGLEPENVFVGNGSDEVLALCFAAFFDDRAPLRFPDISYSFYPVYADLFGVPYETIPVGEHFEIRPEHFAASRGGVIFPNPNAPTSLAVSLNQIEHILRESPESVVIVDEAYVDFGAESAVALLGKYENLLVVQTFSKSRSLAGLRVGFAFGSKNLIAALEAAKNSFNSYTVDRVAQAGAEAAVLDTAYFEGTRKKIMKTREWAAKALQELGFTVLPSQTNFLFASHSMRAAAELYAALREKGILVRYFNKPRIDNYLRITVGTEEEMRALISALKEIL